MSTRSIEQQKVLDFLLEVWRKIPDLQLDEELEISKAYERVIEDLRNYDYPY